MAESKSENQLCPPLPYLLFPYQFPENPSELSITDRYNRAEQAALERNCTISSHLRNILNRPDDFFHQSQQSAAMMEDFQSRKLHSYTTMRKSIIDQKTLKDQALPSKIRMLEVNPTKITLSLECETKYYRIMMDKTVADENIASIMYKTNTLIQLPDKSKSHVAMPHVQLVTITGLYKDVEKARVLLRDNYPIVVHLRLKNPKVNIVELKKMVEQTCFLHEYVFVEWITSKTNPGVTEDFIRFTCRAKYERYLDEVWDKFNQVAFNNAPPKNPFVICYDVSSYHYDFVICNKRINFMKIIESKTNTEITYPEKARNEKARSMITQIMIHGDLQGVLEARRQLQELLPVTICFNINDNEMKASVKGEKRNVHLTDTDDKVIVSLSPSKFEPQRLLPDEDIQHCVTLNSKEFNIKNMYKLYNHTLQPSLGVSAPEPREFDSSIWHNECPIDEVTKHRPPCRGEIDSRLLENGVGSSRRANREARKTSECPKVDGDVSDGEQLQQNSTRRSSVSSVSYEVLKEPAIPSQVQPQVYYTYPLAINPNAAKFAGNMMQPMYYPNFLQQPVVYFPDHPNFTAFGQVVRPELLNHGFANAEQYNAVFNSLTIQQHQQQQQNQQQLNTSDAETVHQRKESMFNATSVPINIHRKTNSSKHANSEARACSLSGIPKLQEIPINEEEFSKYSSRRTSVSGDEPVFGSFEGFHQSYRERVAIRNRDNYTPFRASPIPKEHNYQGGKRGGGMGFHQKNFHRNDQYREAEIVGSPTNGQAQYDHPQRFSETQHLQLKNRHENENQVDADKFYLQDISMVVDESNMTSHQGQTSLNSSFEHHDRERSRTASLSNEREENLRKYCDAERFYSGVDNMIGDRKGMKKGTSGVTKTILEPRYKKDKQYEKINLEPKEKYSNVMSCEMIGAEKIQNRGTSYNPEAFIKMVGKKAETSQKPVLSTERTYSDILHEKKLAEEKSDQSLVTNDLTVDNSNETESIDETKQKSDEECQTVKVDSY